MADYLVVKVKCDGGLRRFSLERGPNLSFDNLVKKIEAMFGLPKDSKLNITYVDDEGDAVTMADHQDFVDAVSIQELNPLKLNIAVQKTSKVEENMKQEDNTTAPAVAEDFVKEVRSAFEGAMRSGDVKNPREAILALEPVLKKAPKVFVDIVDAFVKQGFVHTLDDTFTVDVQECMDTSTEKPEGAVQDSKASRDEVKSCGKAEKTIHPEHCEKKNEVIHTGIQCDVCGTLPISGIRFKSIVKHDFDLCSECYAKHGKSGEYIKLERPMMGSCNVPLWGHGVRFPTRPGCSLAGRVPVCCPRAENEDGRMDARFVCDVTIFDGTEVAPGVGFTKIWRLRNSGDTPWPQGTRLVHVGGDSLGHVEHVQVSLPEGGLPVGAEVEVCVDMVAPLEPGRYVSHWRLMAPGGKRFGHRMWTLVQVLGQGEPSPQVADSLTQSPPGEQVAQQMYVHVPGADEDPKPEAEPKAEAQLVPEVVVPRVAVAAAVKALPEVESSPVEKTSVGGFSLVELAEVEGSAPGLQDNSGSQPQVQETEEETPVVVEVPVFVVGGEEVLVEKEGPQEEDSVKAHEAEVEAKLHQLEAMGFGDRVLNLQVLREAGFEVQAALDKLLAAAEWDPMLQELEEMGFSDTTTNRLLMMKNNGSIKQVVKELVQKYKEK